MKKWRLRLALAASALMAVAPAHAAIVVNGSSGVAPTAGVPSGQGSVLATSSTSLQAETFAATFNQAVYRNLSGFLDFYFQVLRTGGGSLNNTGEIDAFTVANFAGFSVDGFAAATDPDGAGLFVAANNPALADGTPSGSTTTFGRSVLGDTLRIALGLNGLTGTENSATYIFRTNATNFNALGTFGIIDSSAVQGRSFEPTAAIPEPATWAMMLVGVGFVGFAMRRRKQSARIRFA